MIKLDLGLETRDSQQPAAMRVMCMRNKPGGFGSPSKGCLMVPDPLLPNSVAGTVVDLGGGRWQVTTGQQAGVLSSW